MIMSHDVREVASTFLDVTLRAEAPGALRELKLKNRFEPFISDLTAKVNQLDLYAYSRGYERWDYEDFICKMTATYARKWLDAIEHRYMDAIRGA